MNWIKVIIIIGVVAGIALYKLDTSHPGKVVVDANGDIIGQVNKIRASIQGKIFLKDQLRELNSDLAWQLGAPERKIEEKRRKIELEKVVDQAMAKYKAGFDRYRSNEALAEEREAERLRQSADELERKEFDRIMERHRLRKIDELRDLIQIVKIKAE